MQHQIHVYLLLIIYFLLNLMFLLQHDKLQLNVDILVQLFEFLIAHLQLVYKHHKKAEHVRHNHRVFSQVLLNVVYN
jgi:hypothetical protein